MITLLDYASTLQNAANRAKDFTSAVRMVAIPPTDPRAIEMLATNSQTAGEFEADFVLLETVIRNMRAEILGAQNKANGLA